MAFKKKTVVARLFMIEGQFGRIYHHKQSVGITSNDRLRTCETTAVYLERTTVSYCTFS